LRHSEAERPPVVALPVAIRLSLLS
jgi:hypothetical protein